jgi:hypothetical protein
MATKDVELVSKQLAKVVVRCNQKTSRAATLNLLGLEKAGGRF